MDDARTQDHRHECMCMRRGVGNNHRSLSTSDGEEAIRDGVAGSGRARLTWGEHQTIGRDDTAISLSSWLGSQN